MSGIRYLLRRHDMECIGSGVLVYSARQGGNRSFGSILCYSSGYQITLLIELSNIVVFRSANELGMEESVIRLQRLPELSMHLKACSVNPNLLSIRLLLSNSVVLAHVNQVSI